MSMALQQEVVALREQLVETRTQLSKLVAQLIVETSKRNDLVARVAQLEDAFASLRQNQVKQKEQPHGNARAKARA